MLSARNQFAGKVTAVGTVASTISNTAVAELGLEAGKDAVAVIKATEVMIGC